jgi:hypothetical protein
MDPASQDVSLEHLAQSGGEIIFDEESHGIGLDCDAEQADHPALCLAQGSPGKLGSGIRNRLGQETVQKVDAILSRHPEQSEGKRSQVAGLHPEPGFQFRWPVHVGSWSGTERQNAAEEMDSTKPLSAGAESDTINM